MADVNNNHVKSRKGIRKRLSGVKQFLKAKTSTSISNGFETRDRTSSVPIGLDIVGTVTDNTAASPDAWKSDVEKVKSKRRQSSLDHKELERITSKYRRPKKISITSIDENLALDTPRQRPNSLRLSWMSQTSSSFDRPRSYISESDEDPTYKDIGQPLMEIRSLLNNLGGSSFQSRSYQRLLPDQESMSSFQSNNNIYEADCSDVESYVGSMYDKENISDSSEALSPCNNNTEFHFSTKSTEEAREAVQRQRSFDVIAKVKRTESYIDDSKNNVKQVLDDSIVKHLIEIEAANVVGDKDYDIILASRWSKDICNSVRDQIRLQTGIQYKIIVNAFIGSVKWSNADSTHISIRNSIDPEKDCFVVSVFENKKVFISVCVLISKC